MRISLKTRKGLSRLRQARKYCKTTKDVLELVKSISGGAADDVLGQRLVGPTNCDVVDRVSPNKLPQDSLTDLRNVENIYSSLRPEGSIVNRLSAVQRKDELDLHALIEHFEEFHVAVDPCSQPLSSQPCPPNYHHSTPPANPTLDPLQPLHHHHVQQQYQQGPFDPDGMEIDMDSYPAASSGSPLFFTPVTTVTTHFVPHTTQHAFVNASSFPHSSLSQPPFGFLSSVSASDPTVTTAPQSRPSTFTMAAFSHTQPNSFGTYSACSECGAVTSSYLQASQEIMSASSRQPARLYSRIPPTFPYDSSSITPANTLSSTGVASPLVIQDQMQASYCPSSSSPSPSMSAGSQSAHYPQGLSQSQYSPSNVVDSLPSLTQEHVPASPPDQQCVDTTSTSSSSALGHVPTSQSPPSRILAPPDKLHPTLSCWIKNMNKLSILIDRLQELASSAPAEHRSQLLGQVVELRIMSKKQKEHFMEFLRLSEEYANGYLLDISDEIKRQSSFLDKLEGRLEAAKKLRGEAVNLQKLYKSGTVATMKDLRATALSRPLPEDQALFSELESVLAEVRRCYMELERFWTEEICRAIEALKMHRIDPTDLKRWKTFHANLKKFIESWKTKLSSGDTQTLRRNSACSSTEADIGAIASSFLIAMGSLTSALDRLLSSNSLKYSQLDSSSIQPVYVAFAANSDMCLSLLRSCAKYGEKLFAWCPLIPLPTSSHVGAPHDLRERTMRLLSEMAIVSVENATSVQGSRKFKAAYNKATSLEQKMTSEVNSLVKKLSELFRVTETDGDGHPDDARPDVVSLKQLRKLWEEAGDSLRGALETLKDEPPLQLSTRPLSVMKRWLMNLVYIS